MDGQRFDAVARALAGGHGRREFLKALLVGAVPGFAAAGAVAAAGEPCSGDHLECGRTELCLLDDATGRLACARVAGRPGGRLCKSPTEYDWCGGGTDCCVSPALRDPPGEVQLVVNCCERGVTACDPQLGCVPVA
jgi:hypothetical protein